MTWDKNDNFEIVVWLKNVFSFFFSNPNSNSILSITWLYENVYHLILLLILSQSAPFTLLLLVLPHLLPLLCTSSGWTLTSFCVTMVPGHIAAQLLPSPLFFVSRSSRSLLLLLLRRGSPDVGLVHPNLNSACPFLSCCQISERWQLSLIILLAGVKKKSCVVTIRYGASEALRHANRACELRRRRRLWDEQRADWGKRF